jgi:hypothetical protein
MKFIKNHSIMKISTVKMAKVHYTDQQDQQEKEKIEIIEYWKKMLGDKFQVKYVK